jgi:predicted naringenin-chalcone synthase
MAQAYIAATGIALPTKVETEQFLQIDQKMRARHGQSREIREKIKGFVDHAKIASRHSVCPGWYKEPAKDSQIEDIFTPHDFDPPAHLRAKMWHEQAPKIAIEAAKAALANWDGSVADITHVVTTSTTGWAEPGIAVELIEQLGLSQDTRKIEININGCFCGASCLRTARDIVKGGESGAVLVVAVELSSIQYNIVDTDISTLISSSLFGDGAGAIIVSPKKGPWLFEEAGMSLVPDTKHMLRLHPDFEKEANACKMFLHQGVAKALAQYFTYERGKGLIDHVLKDLKTPPHLAVHPGGPNILDALQGVFIERGWPQNCLDDSYSVLRETGNLGSAAVLFVLHKILNQSKADDLAYFAFGPGVTVEWAKIKNTYQARA